MMDCVPRGSAYPSSNKDAVHQRSSEKSFQIGRISEHLSIGIITDL
jgi:hypothetical protein